jgi:hypothetical protein
MSSRVLAKLDISDKPKAPKVKPYSVITMLSTEIKSLKPASYMACASLRRSATSFAEGVKREVVISSPIGVVGH